MTLEKMQRVRRICAVTGPLLLLFAWAAQQFLFDRWNGAVNRLDSAEAVWDIYRSNHYVLNAMRPEGLDDDKEANQPAVKWQLRNLEVGSSRLEAVMNQDVLKEARQDVNESEDGGFGGPDGAMDLKFKTLQLALGRERQQLKDRKANAQTFFWAIYALGASITFFSTLLKERIEARQGK